MGERRDMVLGVGVEEGGEVVEGEEGVGVGFYPSS